MKVIVPNTRLHPVVAAVLRSYEVEPQFVHVPAPDGYWRLLSGLWAQGETIVLVEHDVLPWPRAIEELYDCPALWCSCSYRMDAGTGRRAASGITHGFGCTKLSGELMRLLPDVWKNSQREWWTLDAQLCAAALAAQQTPHQHRPDVIHLKQYKGEKAA